MSAPEPVVDLGPVQVGGKSIARFPIRNEGGADLVVRRFETNCGCAIAKILDEEGQPKASARGAALVLGAGEGAVVEVAFDAEGQPEGWLEKRTTLHSNDPLAPELPLYLRVQVVRPFVLEPPEFAFGEVRRGERSERSLVARATPAAEGARIVGFAELPEWLEGGVEDADGAQTATLRVLPGAPVGYLQPVVQLATNHPSFPTVPVRAIVRVRPPIRFDGGGDGERERLDFGTMTAGATAERVLEVVAEGDADYPIRAVEVEASRAELVETRLETLESGRHYRIHVRLRAPDDARSVRGNLSILADGDLLPQKRIPFQAFVQG